MNLGYVACSTNESPQVSTYFDFKSEDLKGDQGKILKQLSRGGVNIVTGPPGSGKTILAFQLGMAIEKQNRKDKSGNNFTFEQPVYPIIIAFNKVLKQFASGGLDGLYEKDYYFRIGVDSAQGFFQELWDSGGLPGTVPRQRYGVDYNRFMQKVFDCGDRLKMKGNFHAIIDEAQDYHPDLFRALCQLRLILKSKPSITVFCDPNQTITNDQSTLLEITRNLEIDQNDILRLRDNFRNTRPIVQLANHFAVDGTENQNLPKKNGKKPKVILVEDADDASEYIGNIIKQNPNKKVLLVIPARRSKWGMNLYFNLMGYNQDVRKDYEVQGYRHLNTTKGMTREEIYKQAHVVDAHDLVFEENRLTILFDMSCKGLDADIVFCAEMQYLPTNDEHKVEIKRLLYTVATRAKEEVYFFYNTGKGNPEESVEVLQEKIGGTLPHPKKELWDHQFYMHESREERINHGATLSEDLDLLVSKIQWRDPLP